MRACWSFVGGKFNHVVRRKVIAVSIDCGRIFDRSRLAKCLRPVGLSAGFLQGSWHQQPDAAGMKHRMCTPAANIRQLGFATENNDSAFNVPGSAIRWELG